MCAQVSHMTTAFKMRQHHTRTHIHTYTNCTSLCTSAAPTHHCWVRGGGASHWGCSAGGGGGEMTVPWRACSRPPLVECMKHQHLAEGVVEENHAAREGRWCRSHPKPTDWFRNQWRCWLWAERPVFDSLFCNPCRAGECESHHRFRGKTLPQPYRPLWLTQPSFGT